VLLTHLGGLPVQIRPNKIWCMGKWREPEQSCKKVRAALELETSNKGGNAAQAVDQELLHRLDK